MLETLQLHITIYGYYKTTHEMYIVLDKIIHLSENGRRM
jgi:hypothetical protein